MFTDPRLERSIVHEESANSRSANTVKYKETPALTKPKKVRKMFILYDRFISSTFVGGSFTSKCRLSGRS